VVSAKVGDSRVAISNMLSQIEGLFWQRGAFTRTFGNAVRGFRLGTRRGKAFELRKFVEKNRQPKSFRSRAANFFTTFWLLATKS